MSTLLNRVGPVQVKSLLDIPVKVCVANKYRLYYERFTFVHHQYFSFLAFARSAVGLSIFLYLSTPRFCPHIAAYTSKILAPPIKIKSEIFHGNVLFKFSHRKLDTAVAYSMHLFAIVSITHELGTKLNCQSYSQLLQLNIASHANDKHSHVTCFESVSKKASNNLPRFNCCSNRTAKFSNQIE